MKFIVFILLFSHVLTSIIARAYGKSIGFFMVNDPVAHIRDTNIVVTKFQLIATSADEGAYKCSFEWVMDYNPRQLFKTITDTNNGAYAYTYFDRIKHYILVTNWVIKDTKGNLIGRGTPVLPAYPERMLHIVFTNTAILIDHNHSGFTLECSVSQNVSKDMLTGILSGDQITLYPNVPKVQLVHETGEQVTLLKPLPAPVTTILSRWDGTDYQNMTSFQRVGEDYLITAQIDPQDGRMLQATSNLSTKFTAAGDSYVTAPAGEIFILVPNSFATNANSFYKLTSSDFDLNRAAFVEAHIKLPGEGNNNTQYFPSIRAGTIPVTADIKVIPTPFNSPGILTYTWLSDEGESMRSIGRAQTFHPTFRPGVHWIKLYVTSHNVDAAFFTWVLVK